MIVRLRLCKGNFCKGDKVVQNTAFHKLILLNICITGMVVPTSLLNKRICTIICLKKIKTHLVNLDIQPLMKAAESCRNVFYWFKTRLREVKFIFKKYESSVQQSSFLDI